MTDPIQVTVCMPWRPEPERIPAYERCRKWWEDRRFTVVTGDSSRAMPFNVNEARNNAVRQTDTDIIVVTDADTLPENLHHVIKAISMVDQGEMQVIWPYTVLRYIPQSWVEKPTDELHQAPILGESFNPPAGMIVASREAFWSINGYDEHFPPGTSDFDDASFMYAAEALLNTMRLTGTAYSFDHAGRENDIENGYDRYMLYRMCRNNPDLMSELVK